MTLSAAENEDLRTAKRRLETPGLAAKISNYIGAPIEHGFALLPEKWNALVNEATRQSIATALDVALWSMDRRQARSPSDWWRRLARAHGPEELKRSYHEFQAAR